MWRVFAWAQFFTRRAIIFAVLQSCIFFFFSVAFLNSIFFGAAISQLINHQATAALNQRGLCKHFKSSKNTCMPFLQINLDLILSTITSVHQLVNIQLYLTYCSPWSILFPLCKHRNLINISISTSNKKQFYYWILLVILWAADRRVAYKRNGIYWQIDRSGSQGNV